MLLNGHVVGEQDAPKAFANRGFLVADGVFESMRFTDNRVPYLGLHVARLHAALAAHGMDVPDSLHESSLKESLEVWRQTWSFDGDARIRLTAYREGQGKYTPDTDDTSWVATVERMDARGFSLRTQRARRGHLPRHAQARVARQSVQEHRLDGLRARRKARAHPRLGRRPDFERGPKNHRVLSVQPVRGVQRRALHPELGRRVRGGIMRAVLIRTALDHGVKVYECTLTPQTLLQADELFLTNAVRGIEWVASYKTKRYFHSMAEKLTAWIQDDLTSA